MTSLSDTETERLRALLQRFDLVAAEDIILPQAKPCIVLLLDGGRIFPRPDPWPDIAAGSSFMGGLPDLPQDWEWPLFTCEYSGRVHHAGFIMQIALEEITAIEGSPLPRQGMLYVFHRDQCAEFQRSFDLRWFGGPKSALRRTAPPDLPCASELDVCFRQEPFPLKAVTGADIAPKGQHDDDIVSAVEARLGSGDYRDPSATSNRYYAFQERARIPNFDALEASGYPVHWWHAGQLLGHVDRDNRQVAALSARGEDSRRSDYAYRKDIAARLDEEAEAWPLLLQIETNAISGFAGGCDAAPVLIQQHDDGARPWTDFSRVRATLAP